MGREIERKYLVREGAWSPPAEGGRPCVQGYIPGPETCAVRVRLMGDRAFLTLKAAFTAVTRAEYEYAIPPEDAREMLELLCGPQRVEKTRYVMTYKNKTWEVDEFHGANEGLVLAEIELAREDEPVATPPWVGRDVTEDYRYHNSNLAAHPWSRW